MPAEFIQNFSVGVQRSNSSIGTTATAASILTNNPNFPDCLVINNGTVGVQLAFGSSSVVALNTAAAGGTTQIYVPAGAVMVIGTNGGSYYSAITDSGTGSLILLAGAGS